MAKAGRTRGASVPKDETKAQKFSRLASKRVGSALDKINLIGALSGKGYERTDAQVAKIEALLNDAVRTVIARFKAPQATAGKPSVTI